MSETIVSTKGDVSEKTHQSKSSASFDLISNSFEDKGSLSGSSSSSPSHVEHETHVSKDLKVLSQEQEEHYSKNIDNSPPKENDKVDIRHRYSRRDLMVMRYSPICHQWPDCLDISFKKKEGIFDLDKWLRATQDSKRNSSSSNSSQSSGLGANGNDKQVELEVKKAKDPRERIKQEEQDGIVLSPQRRSFGTGCRVLGQSPSNLLINRSESPAADRTTRESHREMPTRRIGSGRLLRRDDAEQLVPDRRDARKERDQDRDSEQRRDHRDWRSKNDSRYGRERDERYDKRRRFFEEEDRRHDRRDMRDRRYQDQRRSHEEEEAPEWFTGGPSSQNEFIELVGFDEEDRPKPKRDKKSRFKKDKDGGSGRTSRSNTPVIIEQEEPPEDNKLHGNKEKEAESQQIFDGVSNAENPVVVEPSNDQDNIQFNIDDYLADILNIGSEELSEVEGASRLKQFFKQRESPIPGKGSAPSSRRSSIDLCPQVGNLLGFTEPVIRIPSPNQGLDSPHFFAPISPANRAQQNSLVDMLQHGRPPQSMQPDLVQSHTRLQPPSIRELLMGGKGQSLEEIEAGLKNQQISPIPSKAIGSNPAAVSSSNHSHSHPSKSGLQNSQPSPHSMPTPFNDFLSKISSLPQKSILPSQRNSDENVISKLLSGKNSGGCQPAVPNNAPTERDVIAMLIKNGGNSVPHSQMNGSSIPPPNACNSLHPTGMPASVPHPSPSRSHLAPPPNAGQTNQDLMMKLFHKHQQQQQIQKQQIFQQQHDPIKQLVGGVNNMSLNSSSHPPQNDATLREAIMRSDVQTLLQRLINGQVSENHLINQLGSGNLSEQQRSVVAASLKLLHNHNHSSALLPPRATLTPSPTPQAVIPGGIALGNTPVSLSPRVASPNPDATNMLAAPHVMPPNRVSPLMFSGGTVAGAGPRRLITHQDLVVHTQSILQNALLKQELEKAREKHRKREAERTRSPNPVTSINNGPPPSLHSSNANRIIQDGSPLKCGMKRQSPLAFTPTSVMRKMTAEKDKMEKEKMNINHPLSDSGNLDDKQRDAGPNLHLGKMSTQQILQAHPSLKPDGRRDLHRAPSPIPPPNVMLGPKAQMVLNGQNPNGMLNLGVPPPTQPPQGMVPSQRHIGLQPMPRSGQHNLNSIRAFQSQNQLSGFPQQMMRPQGTSPMHCSPMGARTPHAPPPRVPNAHNSISLMGLSSSHNQNNINNNPLYKTGDSSLQVPSIMNNSHRNSPVNLVNIFGRDVMAQVQAGSLPELPGGKVLSLEEVERLQQTQAVPN